GDAAASSGVAPQPLPAPAPPVHPERSPAQSGRRVGIIGAGPSGLTAARELERLGYAVTVFEAAADVAGKSASIDIDGYAFDLGGHVCSLEYRELADLVQAMHVQQEPVSPVQLYDITQNRVLPREEAAHVRENYLRYWLELRQHFPELVRSPLARYARLLAT